MRRYRKVKDAIDLFGEDDVRKIGVDGVVALTRKEIVEDESGRKKVWRKINAYVIENRVAPPPAIIRQIVRNVFPPPSVKSGSKTTSREEVVEARALEQENATLREEVATLRRKNVELEMRVEELESENKRLFGKKARKKAA